MPELWARASDVTNRKLRKLFVQDGTGINRKQREFWVQDGTGVNRRIFSGYDCQAAGYYNQFMGTTGTIAADGAVSFPIRDMIGNDSPSTRPIVRFILPQAINFTGSNILMSLHGITWSAGSSSPRLFVMPDGNGFVNYFNAYAQCWLPSISGQNQNLNFSGMNSGQNVTVLNLCIEATNYGEIYFKISAGGIYIMGQQISNVEVLSAVAF